MKIDIIAGARPNFMKIAPIIDAIKNYQTQENSLSFRLIHTGQHYDKNMSDDFFTQLGIPEPDVNLEVGSGTQAEQTANIMIRYEKLLLDNFSNICLVVGDVTSTMACSIVAKKLGVKVVHVEAGIRSFDLTMPEEINRMVTDSITDYFFTTSEHANENLKKAGIEDKRIFYVGNTMIDTLLKQMPNFIKPAVFDELNLKPQNYFVLTMHRPANVDEAEKLQEFLNTIESNVNGCPVLFPVHPRTAIILKEMGLEFNSIYQIPPMSYLEFNYLVQHAKCVITDSGGITEETTVMGVPCMTLRDNTERPETINEGTNELIGTNPQSLIPALKTLFNGDWKKGSIPHLWDGKTADRIIKNLIDL
ncbi:UDP-N-acetylglucosamine 2-epimerase (non-hydrolyzing) [Flavobacteriaceae bacterium]|nr:UDP-N-acetylglucosamine 2-epimerase (non-hydrolyzing) [Flavobacteriaceae bacterium]